MCVSAVQRDEALRASFANELSVYKANMFVFLDETGTSSRDVMRKYGYSWRGRLTVAQKPLVRGQHLSSISIMSTAELLDCVTMTGAVDGDTFYEFVHKQLLPHLKPFDGTNEQLNVVMDNASIHHVDGIVEMIQEVGAMVMFIPPYSPDFNTIEELFSKLKKTIKWFESQLENEEIDLQTIVYSSFCQVTVEDCCGWIANSGIYN